MNKCGWLLFILLSTCWLLFPSKGYSWGFFAHRLINRHAVFLLPPQMVAFYKPHIWYLAEHAVDPDKRRYAVSREGPRHYIDMDRYGPPPYLSLPRQWWQAVDRFTADTLNAHGIVPWWIQVELARLTDAFRGLDLQRILKLSAEIGHYIGDAHVPLHACSNHNGQYSNQRGIHGFWESRIPELLAGSGWDLINEKARYLSSPLDFIWEKVLESAAAADTVLSEERRLSSGFSPSAKFAYESRNGALVKQYSTRYALAYDRLLKNMVERRFRESVFATASFWYTAWMNAGRPSLTGLNHKELSEEEQREMDEIEKKWRAGKIVGRACE